MMKCVKKKKRNVFPKVTNEKLLILSHWFDCCRMSLFFNVFLYKVRTFMEIQYNKVWKWSVSNASGKYW